MIDNGTLSPGERFDRLEVGMAEFRKENRECFDRLGDTLSQHINDDRLLARDIKEALKANKRIDEYEEKLNKVTRRAFGGAALMLLVFNIDRVTAWIKALF